MVDTTILAIGAVAFLVVLILILRNGAKEEPKKPSKKDKKQKQLQAKQQKPKKGRNALKKSERAGIPSEWHVVGDSAAKDASEVLEFLKGKDPNEIAKQQVATKTPTKKKANKKTKDEVQSSEDSATDDGSYEGFEEVKKKTPATDKKKKKKEDKKEKKQEGSRDNTKPYFKDEKKEEKGKRERKPRKSEGEGPEAQQKDGERRERREPREKKEGEGERKREPRPPKEPREPREERRPVTSAPNVKYEEQAGIDEILNTITQDYKPKKQSTPRIPSIFSKIERILVVKKILAYLTARDLVALSAVNQYFLSAARNDELWKRLCVRDFAINDKEHRRGGFRALYRSEFLKKKNRKPKKDGATTPQGEEKDNKGKKNEQASKEVVQE